jgi:hypothetical protein
MPEAIDPLPPPGLVAHDGAIILGLFQTYVDTITALESRRAQMSGVYASILGAIIAATGLDKFDTTALSVAALFMSAVWLINLAFFRTMAEVKWKTALRIEALLPITPFSDEYVLLKQRRALRSRLHLGFIARERILPLVVLLMCLGLLGLDALRYLQTVLTP